MPRDCDRSERADGATCSSRQQPLVPQPWAGAEPTRDGEERARAGVVWGLREAGTRGVTQDRDPGPAGPSAQLLSPGVMVMPPGLQSTRGAGRRPPASGEFVCFYVSSNVLKLLLEVQLVEWDQFWQELDPPKALFGSMGMAHRAQSAVPLRWEQGRLSTTGNTPVFQESITCC